MFGLSELAAIIYLASFAFYLLAIINSAKIKGKKIFYLLLSILSLPALILLIKLVNNLLIQINIISSLEGSVILFLLSTIAVLLIEIVIYVYIRRIKIKTIYKEG
ncbi:MAG TPA: hypothetical protein DEA57_04685 [Sulfurihydrogenibium sp.]|uniref:hypothetical protein n=1 Tax=Sulfurihydrogenibium sp. (strain YO3AOP1) TaxID=436114 RepID=UPI0001750BF6|nr:hypothetical protein [Sulfurihydrogenibium sp. YO3AOP1]ACD67022.1 hypothetical protein SYO3AOP1_1420 [Sulfurihydrogenibium sp. YO3AOP1]HBT98754.1 hypothetical protein [Sulfurihydrogenibium sp.]